MANETTTATLDDITHASLIGPFLIRALSEKPGTYVHGKEFDLTRAHASPAIKIPAETAWWGSANDDGAGVDTEWDATQGTDLSNTAISTGAGVTVTPGEYGVLIELADNVGEDSVSAIDIFNWIQERMLHVISLAITDDFIALYANLSNTVGTSGSDLTPAQLIAAQQGLRTRGVDADALVYVLDNQQVSDVESALSAASTSVATFALSADRLINYAPTADNGMGSTRQVMTFRGIPVYATGLTDTANTAADVVGACYAPSTAHNDTSGATTFASVWKRMPRIELDRNAEGRATKMVMTARWGGGEMQDGAGTAIITDA